MKKFSSMLPKFIGILSGAGSLALIIFMVTKSVDTVAWIYSLFILVMLIVGIFGSILWALWIGRVNKKNCWITYCWIAFVILAMVDFFLIEYTDLY